MRMAHGGDADSTCIDMSFSDAIEPAVLVTPNKQPGREGLPVPQRRMQ
jgi:hypothetical protein